jgi:hypothetical protein
MYKSNIRWLRERERERTIEPSSSLVARWLKGHPLSMSVERAIVTNKRPPPQRSISLSQRRAIYASNSCYATLSLAFLFCWLLISFLFSSSLFIRAFSLSSVYLLRLSLTHPTPPPTTTTTTHCYCSTEMRQICLI